ncbi:MAG TPA: substrate-binding and VWA domain-containing protein [Pilimelia sp.]|nr:substrate-binding and VWA domain-containing protein [Pilimelia sp.]
MVASVLRHRRTNRTGWAAVAAVAVIAVVGGSLVYARHSAAGCSGTPVQVNIVASPDQAPLMRRLADQWTTSKPAVDGQCVGAVVRPMPPGAVATQLGPGWDEGRDGPRPDVWAPDFSAWLLVAAGRPDAAGLLPQATPASLASSPVVIAMQRPMAEVLGWPGRQLGWSDLIGTFAHGKTWAQLGHPEWGPLRIGMPDPTLSTAGQVAIMTVLDTDNNQNLGDNELFAGLLLSQLATPEADDSPVMLRNFLAADSPAKLTKLPAAFPVLERDLAEYAANKPAVELSPIYPRDGIAYADYPYAVLRAPWVDETRQQAAQDFLDYLRSEPGQQAYEAAGFRDPDRGTKDVTLLAGERGFKQEVAAAPRKLTTESLTGLLGMWQVMQRPNNAMLVLDISGSMNDTVPGTRGSRLDLIRKAAMSGVTLLNNQTTIGLWVFSTKLTPATDYLEVVAPGKAGDLVGGVPRRLAIAGAVQKLRARGGTALYDTVLAAYLRMQQAWRPNAQNVLVVMTDGKNEDDVGLSLAQLTARLRAVVKQDQPLPIIGIAVGPQADANALRTISQVTGGRTFVARDDVAAIQHIVLAFAGRVS